MNIQCLDKHGKYIECPCKWSDVVFNAYGEEYIYEIVDFRNDDPNKNWQLATDIINPVIRFVKKK